MRKKKAKEEKRPEVLRFRRRVRSEYLTRAGVLEQLSRSGFALESDLLRFMRLPASMIRGTMEDLEFFDPLSIQPYPMEERDSPPERFRKGAKPPRWINRCYLSVTEGKDSMVITFIDVPRGIFIQGPVGSQGELANGIYRKIIDAGRA